MGTGRHAYMHMHMNICFSICDVLGAIEGLGNSVHAAEENFSWGTTGYFPYPNEGWDMVVVSQMSFKNKNNFSVSK